MISKRIVEEALLAGAAGVVGSIAGSYVSGWGAVVGGAVGAIIGFGFGSAYSADDDRHSLHDHELDRAIGVEGGDIGARRPATAPPKPQEPLNEDTWFK